MSQILGTITSFLVFLVFLCITIGGSGFFFSLVESNDIWWGIFFMILGFVQIYGGYALMYWWIASEWLEGLDSQ